MSENGRHGRGLCPIYPSQLKHGFLQECICAPPFTSKVKCVGVQQDSGGVCNHRGLCPIYPSQLKHAFLQECIPLCGTVFTSKVKRVGVQQDSGGVCNHSLVQTEANQVHLLVIWIQNAIFCSNSEQYTLTFFIIKDSFLYSPSILKQKNRADWIHLRISSIG